MKMDLPTPSVPILVRRGEKRDRLLFFFFFVAYSERPLWLSFLLSLLDEMIACLWTMVFFVGRHDVTTFCLQILFSLS